MGTTPRVTASTTESTTAGSQRPPELVLGTAQLGNRYGVLDRGVEPGPVGARFLQKAAEAGIRTLDTAPAYGAAEAIIGEAAWSGGLHSKVASGTDPVVSLRESLRRTRRDSVDVLYLHDATAVFNAYPFAREEEQLMSAGAKRLGASLYELSEFHAALRHPCVKVLQVPLNVLDRRFGGANLEAAREHGVDVFVRSVFLQGLLLADPAHLPPSTKHLEPFVTLVQTIGTQFDVPVQALVLQWVKRQPLRGVIVGVTSEQELEALVTAWSYPVPDMAVEALSDIVVPDWDEVDPRKWRT